MAGSGSERAGTTASDPKLAAGLAVVTVVADVSLVAADADGPIWLVVGALALATVAVAWRSGGRSRREPLALAALVIGLVIFISFVGFTLADSFG